MRTKAVRSILFIDNTTAMIIDHKQPRIVEGGPHKIIERGLEGKRTITLGSLTSKRAMKDGESQASLPYSLAC